MTIELLIATVEEHLAEIPGMLLPLHKDVRYLVSCQYREQLPVCPDALLERQDVRVVYLKGMGLSRNRNNCLQHAQFDILVIADDDCRYTLEALAHILDTYKRCNELDIALFRVEGMQKYYPECDFRYSCETFRSAYYTASVEMTMRRDRIDDLRFNEHFGLGSEVLAAGEEQVFLYDALQMGKEIHWFPFTIATTAPDTTGERFLADPRVQLSKGAVFCYLFGWAKAYYLCLKEAAHYFVYKHVNPLPLMRNMNKGIRYALQLQKPEKGGME